MSHFSVSFPARELWGAGVCLVSLAAATSALAQDTGTGERVGPQAAPPSAEFEQPTEFPSIPDAPPPSIPAIAGEITLSGVSVRVEGDGVARVRNDFEPLPDGPSGLTLSAGPGTAMDGAWIADQFEGNGLVGSRVAIEQLVAMVQLINRTFIANGYINSGLLIDGALPADGSQLQTRLVLGGLVDDGLDIRFGESGNKGLSAGYVANRMDAALARPLDVIELERDFRLLAEDPAIGSLSADLQPGSTAGEARLALTVRPADRIDAYVGYANSRSPSIGGERFAAGGSIRNIFFGGDTIGGEAGLTSGKPDANLSYQTPIGGPSTRLKLRGGFNEAAVIDPELLPLDITASDWNIEGGLERRLFANPLTPRSDGGGWKSARSLTLGASLAHRVSKTTLLGRPFSFSPGAVNGRSEYTALRLTGDYVERGIKTVLVIALTGPQGLNGSRGDIPGLISPDNDFRSLNAQVSYARLLSEDRLELRLRFAGQVADGILYSGERFAAGGRQTVRGYRETLVLADMGAIGSVELAQPFSLSSPSGQRSGFDWGSFTVSGFVDAALLANREIADPVSDRLASVGASLQWTPSRAVTASVTYAYAIEDAVAPGRRDLQDRGFHFALTLRPLDLFR